MQNDVSRRVVGVANLFCINIFFKMSYKFLSHDETESPKRMCI